MVTKRRPLASCWRSLSISLFIFEGRKECITTKAVGKGQDWGGTSRVPRMHNVRGQLCTRVAPRLSTSSSAPYMLPSSHLVLALLELARGKLYHSAWSILRIKKCLPLFIPSTSLTSSEKYVRESTCKWLWISVQMLTVLNHYCK